MEVGASCYSLAATETAEQRRKDEKVTEIITSCTSLTQYEQKASFHAYFPQPPCQTKILAALLAASFHVAAGMTLAYSAVLIPQLEDPKSDLKVTPEESTWIASCLMLIMPIGNVSGGLIMEKIGRLNTLKLAALPTCLGYVLIATAKNIPMLLVGRLLTGFSSAWGANPAMVFITEIASPQVRGILISIAQTFAALGMVLAYLFGWILDWRIVAWIANTFPILAGLSLIIVPESPAWLVSKDRQDAARKSLEWYYKNFPQPENRKSTLAQMQLDLLVKDNEQKKAERKNEKESTFRKFVRGFVKPTGYKPFLIMFGIFFVQQFTGIYITLFYTVNFVEDIGSDINPYGLSVFIGVIRFIMSGLGAITIKKCTRRGLLIWSTLGMAVCIGISGLFTSFITNGQTNDTWVPILFLLLYIINSSFGLLTIPWIISAELYPLEIRSIAHGLTMSCAHLLMFLSIKVYFSLKDVLGGSAGLQYFFAAVSAVAVLYTFIFLPETKDKKLSDIENYFKSHTVYCGQNGNNSNRNAAEQNKDRELRIAHTSKSTTNRATGIDANDSKNEQKKAMIESV